MVRPEKVCTCSHPVIAALAHSRSHRPYLHVYLHSNEVEETGVISLNGVNIESNPEMEALLGVRIYSIFYSSWR